MLRKVCDFEDVLFGLRAKYRKSETFNHLLKVGDFAERDFQKPP
jgi:hypothetical protein